MEDAAHCRVSYGVVKNAKGRALWIGRSAKHSKLTAALRFRGSAKIDEKKPSPPRRSASRRRPIACIKTNEDSRRRSIGDLVRDELRGRSISPPAPSPRGRAGEGRSRTRRQFSY